MIAKGALRIATALLIGVGFPIGTPPSSSAQKFERKIDPFAVLDAEGRPYVNPFSGGLLEPRIGLRDFDRDGRLDLFTLAPDFRLRVYRNEGAPPFRRVYPSPYDFLPVRNWFRFADLDGDGDDEFFTGGARSEVLLYRNHGTQGSPQFATDADTLRGADGFTIYTQLETVPSLVDIDADGDLDYLMGNVAGDITLYENTGTAAAPTFTFRTSRFQGILVISGSARKDNGPSPRSAARHGASVFGFGDLDGDNDLDLLFGDFFTRRLLLFHNTGTPHAPTFSMTRLDTAFRPNGDNVESEGFNQAEIGDLDGDGDADVLVSSLYPNATTPPIIFYRNEGTRTSPVMRRVSSNVTGEIDEGTFAAPTPIRDGVRNGILIGSAQVTTDATIGTIAYYATDESGGDTRWRLVDVYGVPGWTRVAPAAGDLDGDDQAEIVIGGTSNAGKMKIMKFDGARLVDAPWTIDGFTGINSNTSPALADLDGDDDLDLLVGAENGGIFYFENLGDRSAPQFTRATPPPPLESLKVGKDSAPRFFDLDGDGDADLIIGNRTGGALGGKQTDGVQFFLNDNGTFSKNEAYPDLDLPNRNSPVPMMLHLPRGTFLFLGVEAGGLLAYEQGVESAVETAPAPQRSSASAALWPTVLARGEHSLDLAWESRRADPTFLLIDPLGHIVFRRPLRGRAGTARIRLPELPSGAYLYLVDDGAEPISGRLLILR